ncbi:hypothetical protein [Pseudomonas sp. HUK17]|uniref:hypothetical protein n=1 Tax=Pseudomonas sp. HUK17 TaxID=1799359 RepID=UPI00079496E2|nr:hypothetical protein [Pseudomonas sp. HUK17]KXJ31602.1 hypothetical protein AX284_01750 [Pseudomonas sp. HUK17]
MSIKEKILKMKTKEHVVLKTKPTQGLELKSNPETLAKTKKLMEQAGITKVKAMSPMVDAFLVSADGRVATTTISLDVAPILKTVGVTLVRAEGTTMLTYKLAQQYGSKDVTLDQMLKDKNFKAAYQAVE